MLIPTRQARSSRYRCHTLWVPPIHPLKRHSWSLVGFQHLVSFLSSRSRAFGCFVFMLVTIVSITQNTCDMHMHMAQTHIILKWSHYSEVDIQPQRTDVWFSNRWWPNIPQPKVSYRDTIYLPCDLFYSILLEHQPVYTEVEWLGRCLLPPLSNRFTQVDRPSTPKVIGRTTLQL